VAAHAWAGRHTAASPPAAGGSHHILKCCLLPRICTQTLLAITLSAPGLTRRCRIVHQQSSRSPKLARQNIAPRRSSGSAAPAQPPAAPRLRAKAPFQAQPCPGSRCPLAAQGDGWQRSGPQIRATTSYPLSAQGVSTSQNRARTRIHYRVVHRAEQLGLSIRRSKGQLLLHATAGSGCQTICAKAPDPGVLSRSRPSPARTSRYWTPAALGRPSYALVLLNTWMSVFTGETAGQVAIRSRASWGGAAPAPRTWPSTGLDFTPSEDVKNRVTLAFAAPS